MPLHLDRLYVQPYLPSSDAVVVMNEISVHSIGIVAIHMACVHTDGMCKRLLCCGSEGV